MSRKETPLNQSTSLATFIPCVLTFNLFLLIIIFEALWLIVASSAQGMRNRRNMSNRLKTEVARYKQTARTVKLQRKRLSSHLSLVILLSVNSSTLWCFDNRFCSPNALRFQEYPEAMKEKPFRYWLSAMCIIWYLAFGSLLLATIQEWLHACKNCKPKRFNARPCQNDPSMPGIIVAKVASTLLHKLLYL